MAPKSRPPAKPGSGTLKTSTALPKTISGDDVTTKVAQVASGEVGARARPLSQKTSKRAVPAVTAAQQDLATHTSDAVEAVIEEASAAVIHPDGSGEATRDEFGETARGEFDPEPVATAALTPTEAATPINAAIPVPIEIDRPEVAEPVGAPQAATTPNATSGTEPLHPMAALNEKIADMLRSQLDASLSYWSALADVRSLPDAAFVTLEHARRQVGLSAMHSQDLAVLAREVAISLVATPWTGDRQPRRTG